MGSLDDGAPLAGPADLWVEIFSNGVDYFFIRDRPLVGCYLYMTEAPVAKPGVWFYVPLAGGQPLGPFDEPGIQGATPPCVAF